jgi:HEAT repeat protein
LSSPLRLVIVLTVGIGLAVAVWALRRQQQERFAGDPGQQPAARAAWLDHLYSRNPREAETAAQEVSRLGAAALPIIQETVHDPGAEAERLKAALKACGILGRVAAPLLGDVAELLLEPGLTEEAAIALTHMGPDAFPPLREAMTSDDAMVRREALRSLGKLKERAPLEGSVVVPLLVAGMRDPDGGVRAVAATYLGIVHEDATRAVPALIAGLSDPESEVRRASAAALGSFTPAEAKPALPALRKASRDRNDDVSRQAGQTIVKLQQK